MGIPLLQVTGRSGFNGNFMVSSIVYRDSSPPAVWHPVDHTGIADQELAQSFRIYPSPSKDVFTIEYQMKNASKINIALCDIQGRKLKVLKNEQETAGNYHFSFDAKEEGLSPGIYLLNIASGDNFFTRKIILLPQ